MSAPTWHLHNKSSFKSAEHACKITLRMKQWQHLRHFLRRSRVMLKRITAIAVCSGALGGGILTAAAAAPDLGTANLSWSPGPDTPQIALAIDRGLWRNRGITIK